MSPMANRNTEDADEVVTQSPATSNRSTSLQAAKRPRYTPVACDECKRRKIKCDGQSPCLRCARHPSTCVYSLRGNSVATRQEIEWKKMNEKISKLQEQIDLLVSSAALGGQQHQHQHQHHQCHQAPVTPISASLPEQTTTSTSLHPIDKTNQTYPRRSARAVKHPQYLGPTSSIFSFGVAKTSLQEMGIPTGTNLGENGTMSYATTPTRSPVPSSDRMFPQEPLLSITRDEAIRLVELYEEESGTVYPFIDIESVLKAVEHFYSTATPVQQTAGFREPGSENMLNGGIVDISKLVIAIASVLEDHSPTTLSMKLLEDIESRFEGRLGGPSVDILEIQAWTLMSILQFHCDEEALAWRAIGLAARAAVELGLHRRGTYLLKFSDPQQRIWANKLFWCIYVLDRRWSFGTGLPFALHDDDIDPDLPEQTDSNSYLLKTMIAYGQIGSKVWKATSSLTISVDKETQAFLDFQVRQWQSSIIPELQLHPTNQNMFENDSRTKNRLRVLLYLRANQMRLLIYRRALLSPKTISSDNEGAQKAVNISKDTIRVIDRLNKTSDIYALQQTSFNYFLVSALAAILLAVCHATAQFNQTCREEFYRGLDLVRGFSTKSHVAKRLWKTVRYLKVVGPKLGLFPNQERSCEISNGHHERTMSSQMAGLEHTMPVIEHDLNSNDAANMTSNAEEPLDYNFLLDSNQLGDDLTTLFEAHEPDYGQLPLPNANLPEDFYFYSHETPGGLARSLLSLV